jgi:hypothetical protein
LEGDDGVRCSLSAAPVDLIEDIPNDAEGEDETNELDESIKRRQGTCMGKPLFDRQLLSVPSILALKHVMEVWEKSHRRPIKYTELPESMWLANLQLQLRGVVLGDNSHFVSPLLVNENWLWYGRIG